MLHCCLPSRRRRDRRTVCSARTLVKKRWVGARSRFWEAGTWMTWPYCRSPVQRGRSKHQRHAARGCYVAVCAELAAGMTFGADRDGNGSRVSIRPARAVGRDDQRGDVVIPPGSRLLLPSSCSGPHVGGGSNYHLWRRRLDGRKRSARRTDSHNLSQGPAVLGSS